jgi:hypothetical protein
MNFTYNPACPFALNNFFLHLGYFNMFCGFILDQHMLKESLLFRMTNKFVDVIRHPQKSPQSMGECKEYNHNYYESEPPSLP